MYKCLMGVVGLMRNYGIVQNHKIKFEKKLGT